MMRWIGVLTLCAAITGCGRDASPPVGKSVGDWMESARSPDAKVRKKAVHKLGNLGVPEAWPPVIAALKDVNPGVRYSAVQAVMKFGPKAAEAVGPLSELAKSDKNIGVRNLANQALEKIGREYGATGK